ncbi:MAG: hypothetical protein WBA57_07860 [Elainellaceae cyanobacterium]
MYSRFPSCYKSLNLTLYGVIVCELVLAAAYLATSFKWGYSPDLLDFDGLASLPSFLQAAHLFAVGAIASGLLMVRRYTERPLSWVLLVLLMGLSLSAGLDELTKLYLPIPLLTWKRLYFIFAVAIVTLCWQDLITIWRSHRQAVLWMGIGLGLIAVGGYGLDKVEYDLAQMIASSSMPGGAFHAERIRILIEEMSELLGETLMVFGVSILAFDNLRKLRDPNETISVER